MCGITGVYSFSGLDEPDISSLLKATEAISSRGPDAQRTWQTRQIGLGHRRLSIIDTSEKGLQPMFDSSDRYAIVYNGEVYNYKAIKKDLIAKGYRFHSETDTEVVLNAYIEWGPEALRRFNGFFALAIYNTKDKKLFLARDRYGIKPLVYYQAESKFYFASELKSLVCYGWNRVLDPESLNLFFQLAYIPPPKTIFKGVQKLEPGHYLEVNGEGIDKSRYYDIPYSDAPVLKDPEDAKRQVRSALEKSVVDRLVSDVPLGSFLSGGIDSSIVTSIAAKHVSGFNTFSIGFEDNKFFDETYYAELVADWCETDHHTFKLTKDDLYENLENITNYLDEPFADSSAIPVYILSKLTRDHVTVALSGDGADEVFSGYNKHVAWQMSNKHDLFNGTIGMLRPVLKRLPQSRNSMVSNFFRQLNRYASIQKMTSRERYWILASFGSEKLRKQILMEGNSWDLQPFVESFIDDFKDSSINRMLMQDVRTVLTGDMLAKVDFMSMANSLEVRVPFLDHELVKVAFQIPDNLKIRGNVRKHILREAFKEDLPEELYGRGKQGFEVPLLDWFRNEMESSLNEAVFNRELVEDQGIFNWEGLSSLQRQLKSGNPRDAVTHVWQLFVFQKWWRRYFQ